MNQEKALTGAKELSVYGYLDYRQFLRDYYERKKKLNPLFSYSVFSRISGVARSHLYRIIQSKGELVEAHALTVAKACNQNEHQTEYFLVLVLWNQATNPRLKELYWNRLLKAMPRKNPHVLEKKEENIIEDWRTLAIFSLLETQPQGMEVSAIVQRFGSNITREQTELTLARLLSHGFITQKESCYAAVPG